MRHDTAYREEIRKYRPTRLYGAMVVMLITFVAVGGGFIVIRRADPILMVMLLGVMLPVMGIVFSKLFIRITVYHNQISYQKGFGKPVILMAGTVNGMDIRTGMLREGLSQRAATVLKVDTADGKLYDLEITPFALHQRLDIVNDVVSIASGVKLGSAVLEMMNGEDRTVNRQADRIILLMTIPTVIGLIATLILRLHF